MNRTLQLLVLGFSFSLTIFQLAAQENYPDSLTYRIGINFSGSRSSGVISSTAVKLGGQLHLEKRRWAFNNDLSYLFNNTNGRKLFDNWLNKAAIHYHLGGDLNWFPVVLYQFETNVIYRVQNRNRFGVGIGAYPFDKNGNKMMFSTGYYYENETYNGDSFINSDLINSNRRNSSGWFHISNTYTIAKRGAIILDFWYFQSFEEIDDYSLVVLPRLQMNINKHFSFLIRYDWRFENVYLESLSSANDRILFGLNVKLGN